MVPGKMTFEMNNVNILMLAVAGKVKKEEGVIR